jgi:hypothetical protein
MTGGGLAAITHGAGDLGEIARLAEVLVDAGEADVGDMIERFQPVHHRLSDLGRRHLVPARFQLSLDRGDQPLSSIRSDVALATGDRNRPFELAAVERLALTVLFDDGKVAQLDSLEGRKAGSASLALAPPADRRAVFRGPAILHLARFVRAERTAHPFALQVRIDRKAGA